MSFWKRWRSGEDDAINGAAGQTPAIPVSARAIVGAILGSAMAAFWCAATAHAQADNNLRYQLDQRLHIVYYSPEAFGCVRPGNVNNIRAAIATTLNEIRQLQDQLAPFQRGQSSEDQPYIDTVTGMIAHLNDILFRLRLLRPCEDEPTAMPVTPGTAPPGNTDAGGNGGGPDENGAVPPDGDGNGETGQAFPGSCSGNSGLMAGGSDDCGPGGPNQMHSGQQNDGGHHKGK